MEYVSCGRAAVQRLLTPGETVIEGWPAVNTVSMRVRGGERESTTVAGPPPRQGERKVENTGTPAHRHCHMLSHPIREGHSPQQMGHQDLSNHREIVGGTRCLLLNEWAVFLWL